MILCKECNEWVDDVETTIEKHLNEFEPVVHAKRWKNKKKNKDQKNDDVYIKFQYIIKVYFNEICI